MSGQRDLGTELLKQNGGPPSGRSPAQTGAAAVRREQRRVGLWAALALLGWGAVAAYGVASTYFFLVFIYPKLAQFAQSESPARLDHEFTGILAYAILVSNIIWPVLLLAAAALTVVFVLKSRRATLRQIQVSLAEISAEVRQLAETRGP
jgi:type VI protein secretion system component VasF